MNAKAKAILAHIFFIGWIIALIVNSTKKEEYASFYIRQNLGLIIGAIALNLLGRLPLVGRPVELIGGVLLFVGWLMSLIWSVQGEMKPLPWLGEKIQEWFRGL